MTFSEWMISRGNIPVDNDIADVNQYLDKDTLFLQSMNIYSKSDWLKWAILNHPDREGDDEIFKKSRFVFI